MADDEKNWGYLVKDDVGVDDDVVGEGAEGAGRWRVAVQDGAVLLDARRTNGRAAAQVVAQVVLAHHLHDLACRQKNWMRMLNFLPSISNEKLDW